MSQWLKNKKNPPAKAGSIPGLGRFPGEGNGNPLQYSLLGNPMDRGAWQATVQGFVRVRYNLVTKQQQFSTKKEILKFMDNVNKIGGQYAK